MLTSFWVFGIYLYMLWCGIISKMMECIYTCLHLTAGDYTTRAKPCMNNPTVLVGLDINIYCVHWKKTKTNFNYVILLTPSNCVGLRNATPVSKLHVHYIRHRSHHITILIVLIKQSPFNQTLTLISTKPGKHAYYLNDTDITAVFNNATLHK